MSDRRIYYYKHDESCSVWASHNPNEPNDDGCVIKIDWVEYVESLWSGYTSPHHFICPAFGATRTDVPLRE